MVSALSVIARPVVSLLSLSTNGVLRLLGMRTDVEEEQVTEDEIRMMIDLGNENGAIDADEKELLHNVFEFSDQRVGDVMTRAADVISLPVDAPAQQVLEVIRTSGLSRFPIYGTNENQVLGVLNAKEFLLSWAAQDGKGIAALMRPAYLIPESLPADDLLRDMQLKKVHLAVVIDEYGELAGVITVEDLLEEIVGNIYDEFDSAQPQELEQLDQGVWRVSGGLSVEELAEALEIDLPEEEDYDTVGGMVLSGLRTIPQDGSTPVVHLHGLELRVEGVKDHRIRQVLVRKEHTSEQGES